MDLIWTIIGIALLIVGFIGCIVPAVPGPPIAFLALLLKQFLIGDVYTEEFLVICGLFVAGVTVLDFVVPVWGTKKFGGTKYGTWGSTIGLIVGLVFSPFGLISVIIGPFLGAYIGELIGGMDSNKAFKSGLGSFLGFLAGTFMKLIMTAIVAIFFFWPNAF